ncbi:MAG TPA: pyridoxal-phosphate dependent enzyme [Gemmatimonadales bacterium]
MSDQPQPTLPDIERTAASIRGLVRETPVCEWEDPFLSRRTSASLVLKLELFQHTGSFKPRGALTVMRSLPPDALRRGVTAVSAGNHAAAVSFAAARLGSTAKVVMPKTANPARVALCRAWGGEVVLVSDVREAFAAAERIQTDEGRTFVHPFEGPLTTLGTATLGLEFLRQAGRLDAVVVPVGGGGLAAGVAAAVKLGAPGTTVFGVEPVGADSMTRSFAAGSPQQAGPITTIADSLAPPYSLPYSYALCRQHLDDLVVVDDDMLCEALYQLFRGAKLAVEPAGAATTAAILGPLRDRLAGQRVGVIVCGANIDAENYARYLARGAALAVA